MPEERLFFVYGTLRQGDDNDITRLQPAPRFVGTARIQGTMYHLGAYPGVTLGGAGYVVGEVYAIGTALEASLDAIETDYPTPGDTYSKEFVDAHLADTIQRCFVYVISASSVVGKPVITSGDWVKDR